ncbi:chorismate mutase [Peptoniphilus sp. KCTC 25270]|uniref:chorismate mutase n=1 Tax=Peptoniphilus sp. KCTC 25270 TaxID=2897414 RepID=UPI001E6551DF|nr:chorismate mutase [Peptoniphilus sp. KCTC 25270]MCD1147675.1 chorismate mutase [Peptoniphilus sp. KCTC 25270]
MNLEEARKEINAINDQMLELFIRRLELSEKIGEDKRKRGIAILDENREKEILEKMKGKSENFSKEVEEFFQFLFKISKKRQTKG